MAGQWLTLTRSTNTAGTQVVGSAVASYDKVGRMTQLTQRNATAQSLVNYTYQYDLAGQVTQEQHHGETITYTHDLVGQLLSSTRSVQPSESYTYDAVGNSTATGTVIGAGNRILSDAQFTYSYDAEGNLTRKVAVGSGEVTDYTYDYRNRLTSVIVQSAGGIILSTANYTYDVHDRVIKRAINGQVMLSVYNRFHVWADYNATGQVIARYLYGNSYDSLLARWRTSDGLAWYLTDRQKTVRDLWRNGTLVGRREFDTFGKILFTSSDGFADRFAFQGREWEAAAGRYWFRARWYDPAQRQFSSEDPLGFDAGDVNLRRFVGNAPTMFTDPTGQSSSTETALLLAKRGALIGLTLGAICGALISYTRGDSPWTIVAETVKGAVVGTVLGALAAISSVVGGGLAAWGIYDIVWVPDPPATRATKIACFAAGAAAGVRTARPPRSPSKPPTQPPAAPPKGPTTPPTVPPKTPPPAPPTTPPTTPPTPPTPSVETPPVPEVPVTPKPPAPEVTSPPVTSEPVRPPVEPAQPQTEGPTCPGARRGGGECFTAGVPLLTPDGYRLIETLQVGDFVLARDEFDVTGAVAPKVIEKVFVRSALILKLHLGQQVIGTTTEHPFYVLDRGWISADELWEGAELVGHDGITTKITQIEPTREYAVVYNVRVADWHTYFVGAADWGFSVWVHNLYASAFQAAAAAAISGNPAVASWFTSGSPAENAARGVVNMSAAQTQPTPGGQTAQQGLPTTEYRAPVNGAEPGVSIDVWRFNSIPDQHPIAPPGKTTCHNCHGETFGLSLDNGQRVSPVSGDVQEILTRGFERMVSPETPAVGDVIIWETPGRLGTFDAEHSATLVRPVVGPDGSLIPSDTIIYHKPGTLEQGELATLERANNRYPNGEPRVWRPTETSCP